MTYKLLDPSAPQFDESLAGAPATASSTEAVQNMIGELSSPIRLAAQTAEEAARNAVRAHPAYSAIADAGIAARRLWLAHDKIVAASNRNLNLTQQGREESARQAREALEAGLAGVAERLLSQRGDELLADFPANPVPLLSADVAPTATFIVSSADVQLPESFLLRAADLLRRASNPATPTAEQFKLNQLLDGAYVPVLQRYAAAPPKYWESWAKWAAELVRLIQTHIRATWKQAHHDEAVAAVARFRQDFTYLVNMSRQTYEWDDLAFVGATSFNEPPFEEQSGLRTS